MKFFFLGILFLRLTGCQLSAAGTDLTPDVLATLKPAHPRLLATADAWDELKKQRRHDVRLDALLARIEGDGRSRLKQPVLVRELEGKRLLAVSREALNRIMAWAFCFRLTGDKNFLQRAQTGMLNLAAFSYWKPNHFRDVAEMTTAMAIGYDWRYADLDPAARLEIR